MTGATTAATKAKIGNPGASPVEKPKHEMPKFDLPKMEVPASFRELADKGVAQAKKNYEKVQAAAEEKSQAGAKEMTALLEQTYSTATKGVTDYNLKLVEMARANSNAALEFACGLIAMKLLPEMVEFSTKQARKQFDLVTAQHKELWSLAERMATESAEPLKTGVTKAFNNKFAQS